MPWGRHQGGYLGRVPHWQGTPQPGQDGGYPGRVSPTGQGTPPGQVRMGGRWYPVRTTEGVLTTRRAVCLLRSRRRTFLFLNVLGVWSRGKKFGLRLNLVWSYLLFIWVVSRKHFWYEFVLGGQSKENFSVWICIMPNPVLSHFGWVGGWVCDTEKIVLV